MYIQVLDTTRGQWYLRRRVVVTYRFAWHLLCRSACRSRWVLHTYAIRSNAHATVRYVSLPPIPIQLSNCILMFVVSKKLSGRNVVVLKKPNPHDLQTKGPSTGRAGRRSYRLLGPETWGSLPRNKVLCDNWCAVRMGRFMYMYICMYICTTIIQQIASRHLCVRQASSWNSWGITNPRTFTQPWSKVGPAFGVDWTHFCSKYPPPKTRLPISCRSVNRDFGWRWRWSWNSARGTGPKKIRWRPAAWDSSTWRTLHEVGCRWYILLTGALSSACGRSPLHPETEPSSVPSSLLLRSTALPPFWTVSIPRTIGLVSID